MKELDNFYLEQEEPVQSCLLALRNVILAQNKNITTTLKYGMPFFCYKGKMFAYLWIHKKYNQPYIGMVEGKHLLHDELIQEKRSRMKILLINAEKNLPVKLITKIILEAVALYETGKVKI